MVNIFSGFYSGRLDWGLTVVVIVVQGFRQWLSSLFLVLVSTYHKMMNILGNPDKTIVGCHRLRF